MADARIRARASRCNISPAYDCVLSPTHHFGPLLAEHDGYRIWQHHAGFEVSFSNWHLTTFGTYPEALTFAMNCAKAAREGRQHV